MAAPSQFAVMIISRIGSPQDHLTYVGVPIGKKCTQSKFYGMIFFFANKTRKDYGLLVSVKFKFGRHIFSEANLTFIHNDDRR